MHANTYTCIIFILYIYVCNHAVDEHNHAPVRILTQENIGDMTTSTGARLQAHCIVLNHEI